MVYDLKLFIQLHLLFLFSVKQDDIHSEGPMPSPHGIFCTLEKHKSYWCGEEEEGEGENVHLKTHSSKGHR